MSKMAKGKATKNPKNAGNPKKAGAMVLVVIGKPPKTAKKPKKK